jgi:hypothetical protein
MEVATVSKNTITRVLPSKLVSVMLSCRCPAAFCLFALSIAKPHDDLRGPPAADGCRQASQPASFPPDMFRTLLPERHAFLRLLGPLLPVYQLGTPLHAAEERGRFHVAI